MELRGRLALASAALILYGGKIADVAGDVREDAIREAEKWQGALKDRQYGTGYSYIDLSQRAADFAMVAMKRLEKLDDGAGSEVATTDESSDHP